MGNKLILVRSSRELIDDGYVGYGWENVEFQAYNSSKDLLEKGFKGRGVNYGRKKKQIKRFFELEKDDIVVVPVSGAIAIGIVSGEKDYITGSKIPLSANRVKVDFFRDKNNKIMYVPRVELVTNFERRLKIRMSIASLEGFREEIEKIISLLSSQEIYTRDSDMQKREENGKENFIKVLEERLRTEKDLGLAAGGYGLEKLIREIFQAKGYEATIPAKNDRPVGEDVDIVATKEGELRSKGERYLIQAKHHRGTTGREGLDQLIACKDDDSDEYFYRKILITTAKVKDELKKEAGENNIIIVEGLQLAEWIFENLSLLSKITQQRLGISEVPLLI